MRDLKINFFAKILLSTGVFFIAYGIIAKLAPIYFFWESKFVGWMFILLGLISFFNFTIKLRKKEKKKSILYTIGIVLIIFILIIQFVFISILPSTDAYKATVEHLKKDTSLIKEVGRIERFGIFPVGNIKKTSNLDGTQSNATINLLIKGEKKYKNIKIYLNKENSTNWIVKKVDY